MSYEFQDRRKQKKPVKADKRNPLNPYQTQDVKLPVTRRSVSPSVVIWTVFAIIALAMLAARALGWW